MQDTHTLYELDYYEKVKAHRIYQYAMSRYKLIRYKPNDIKDKAKINWQLVDSDLRSAMEKYYFIKVKSTQQPIFMDFIIKIMVIIVINISDSLDLQSICQSEEQKDSHC